MHLEVLISETFILVLMGSGTKSHKKSLISSKILIRSIIVQVIMMLSVNKYGVKCGTSLRFGKIKAGLIK